MSDASFNPVESSKAERKAERKNAALIPWHPMVAIAFVVVTYFVTQVIGAIAVYAWPALHHWSESQTQEWLDSSTEAQFFYVLIAEVLTIVFLFFFLRLYGRGWKAIGFRRPKWSDLGWGALIVPLYYITYILIAVVGSQLVPSLDVDQAQELGFNPIGVWPLVLTFVSLVVLPPLVEETLMRGFLYTSLKKGLPQIGAALVTSGIFAAAHLQFGSDAPLLWIAAVDTFILSLFLIWLREKTGSLWAGITLHALKNAVAFMSLFIFHLS